MHLRADGSISPVPASGGVLVGFVPGASHCSARRGEDGPIRGWAYSIGVVDLDLKLWHRVPYWYAMELEVAGVTSGSKKTG